MKTIRIVAAAVIAVSAAFAGTPARAAPCPAGMQMDEPGGGSLGWFQMRFDSLPHSEWVKVNGPVTVCRGAPIMTGQPDFRTGEAPAVVPVEIVGMHLVSVNPITVNSYSGALGIAVVEDPARQSAGQVTGVFNIHTNMFLARGDSFFDVFFHVCPEPFGPVDEPVRTPTCWRSDRAYRVQTTLNGPLPPDNHQEPYRHANGSFTGLLHAVQLMQARADSGCHKPFFGGGPATDACLMPGGAPVEGVYSSPLELVIASVSETAMITGISTTGVSPCATLGAWSQADPMLDRWTATLTLAGTAACTVTVDTSISFSDGTVRAHSLTLEQSLFLGT